MKKIVFILVIFAWNIVASEFVLVDKNASDMVYNIPLNKYPKWRCEAVLESGKKVQFASVKSMMQVYRHSDYFLKHHFLDSNITKLYVQDFISARKVEATKARYLFGSRMIGPHGDDLIPFENEKNAKLFMMKHGGTKILPFERLSKGLIRYLDM